MADVFDVHQSDFEVTPSAMLTTLCYLCFRLLKPKHNAAYWARVTKGLDFSKTFVDDQLYSRIVRTGIMGNKRYPKISPEPLPTD